jgi:site-specific recombinase XerD
MEKATVIFEVSSKKRKDDRVDILIRITKKKKHKRMSTQTKVFKKDFYSRARWGKWIKTADSMHAVKNEKLKDLYNKAESAVFQLEKQGKSPSLENIILFLKGNEKEKSFIRFGYRVADRFKDAQKVNSYKKYMTALHKLERYTKCKDLTFLDVSVEFLTDYKVYLSQLGNHINTIGKDMSILKSILNKAIREDLMPIERNPFLRIQIQSTKTFKEKLSLEEIKAIEKLELEANSRISHTRNAFLFAFYCAGIRFIDICRLKWENVVDDRLEYCMTKTGETKSIKLIPVALNLLSSYQVRNASDYIFPFLESQADYSNDFALRTRVSVRNAQVNKNLKIIAMKIRTSKSISFHMSRHSFADYARKMGVDMQTIRLMLGHSSLKVTEGYLNSLNDDMMDKAMGEMFK